MEPGGAFGFPVSEALGQSDRNALVIHSIHISGQLMFTEQLLHAKQGSGARTICHIDLDGNL